MIIETTRRTAQWANFQNIKCYESVKSTMSLTKFQKLSNKFRPDHFELDCLSHREIQEVSLLPVGSFKKYKNSHFADRSPPFHLTIVELHVSDGMRTFSWKHSKSYNVFPQHGWSSGADNDHGVRKFGNFVRIKEKWTWNYFANYKFLFTYRYHHSFHYHHYHYNCYYHHHYS